MMKNTSIAQLNTQKKATRKNVLPVQHIGELNPFKRSKSYIDIVLQMRDISEELDKGERQLMEIKELVVPTFQLEPIALQNRITDLKIQLKNLNSQVCKLLPKGDELLSLLFFSHNGDELIRRGVIAGSGKGYTTLEELYENTHAISKEEQRALKKGNEALWERPEPLVVEVYFTKVCKVYRDGTVSVVYI